MKKRILSVLALVLCMATLFSTTVFAAGNTQNVSSGVTNYAMSNIGFLLKFHLESLGLNSTEGYQLGAPVTLENEQGETLYYFPIIFEDSVIYSYCVTLGNDQKYHGSISSAQTGKLRMLNTDSSNILVADIFGTLPVPYGSGASNFLNPTITETQPSSSSNQWCVGYVCAAIVNSVTSANIRSSDVAHGAGIYNTATRIPVGDATSWCNSKYGFHADTSYNGGGVSFSRLSYEIDSGNYVLLRVINHRPDEDGLFFDHAALLRGYSSYYGPNGIVNAYSIWDPMGGYVSTDASSKDGLEYTNSFGIILRLENSWAGWYR